MNEKLQKMCDALDHGEAVPAINAIRDFTANLPDAEVIESHLKTLESFVGEVNALCDAIESEQLVDPADYAAQILSDLERDGMTSHKAILDAISAHICTAELDNDPTVWTAKVISELTKAIIEEKQ